MELTKNFTIGELTKSQTAERRGITNIPDATAVYNLKNLAEKILQPVRNKFGSFMVSSGYRCPELSISIGSSKDSQHCKGQAADFEVANVDNYDLAVWIKDNLEYDQLILECYTGGNTGWVHCSYAEDGRKEVLTYDRLNGYRHGLING